MESSETFVNEASPSVSLLSWSQENKRPQTSNTLWSPGTGDDDEMEEDIDKCEAKEEQVRKGKQFGIPEIDPDALPSSMVQKYLTLGNKPVWWKRSHLLFSPSNFTF